MAKSKQRTVSRQRLTGPAAGIRKTNVKQLFSTRKDPHRLRKPTEMAVVATGAAIGLVANYTRRPVEEADSGRGGELNQ